MKEAHTGRGLKRLLLLSFPHSRHLICNASLHPLAIKHFIHAQLIISMKKTRCLYMDILQGMRKLVLYGPSNYSCNVKLIQLYKKKQTSSEWIKPATLKFSWILLYIYIDKAANLKLSNFLLFAQLAKAISSAPAPSVPAFRSARFSRNLQSAPRMHIHPGHFHDP